MRIILSYTRSKVLTLKHWFQWEKSSNKGNTGQEENIKANAVHEKKWSRGIGRPCVESRTSSLVMCTCWLVLEPKSLRIPVSLERQRDVSDQSEFDLVPQ